MGLAIRTVSAAPIGGAPAGGAPPVAKADDALDAIAKIVPADALAVYVALVAIAPGKNEQWWSLAFFFVGLASTAGFLYLSTKKNNEHAPWWQWVLRLTAFACYAMVIGAPLDAVVHVDPRLPHAAVVLITAFAGALGYANAKTA
jgi:hypothetical protein